MQSYQTDAAKKALVMYWDTEKMEVQSLRWMNEEELNAEEIDECDDEEELAGGYSFMIGKLLRVEATTWAVPMYDRKEHGKPEYLAVLIDNCNGVDLQLLDIDQACSPVLDFNVPALRFTKGGKREGHWTYENGVGDAVVLISLKEN